MRLGAHLSIAGGMWKALVKAGEYGFDTVAVFLRNQRQWRAPELSERTVRRFIALRRELGISPVVAHGSYLVNLAGRAEVREKSIAVTVEDLSRCVRLGIEYLVLHPGCNRQVEDGVRLIAEALDWVFAECPDPRPRILLETTAGQGGSIGSSFEQLAGILGRVGEPLRYGVCLDTCHVFAAGYDIRSPSAYAETMRRFDGALGLGRLLAIHLNDSLRELGSRVDRHAHVGKGRIGRRGLANFVNDSRLTDVPMILETPKGKAPGGRDWDQINAEVVRSLVR
jgi:deoxyribonuclease-4